MLAVAREIGYHPSAVARALRSGKTQSLALVVAARRFDTGLYPAVLASLSDALSQTEIRIVVHIIKQGENAGELIHDLLGWCSMVAVEGSLMNMSLQLAHMPSRIVLLDWPLSGADVAEISSIGFDQPRAIREAVTHLASVGHRNIAWLGYPVGTPLQTLCEEAFCDAMKQACLRVLPEWIVQCSGDGPLDIAAGDALDSVRSAARSRLTAVICASDLIALGVMGALRRTRDRVPETLSVVGYGNVSGLQAANPPLTTFDCSGQALGEALARMALLHQEQPDAPPQHIVLPAGFILRDSTAPRTSHMIQMSLESRARAIEPPMDGRQPDDSSARALFPDGIYQFQPGHCNMVLHVHAWARLSGGTLGLWPMHGGADHLFHLCHAGEGYYTIRNVSTWLFLEVDPYFSDELMEIGRSLIQRTKNQENPDTQLWRFDVADSDAGTYRITNKATASVMDVAGEQANTSALVIAWPWRDGVPNKHQQWIVHPVPFVPGEYELVALHSSLALDLPRGSRASGTIPCQADRMRCLGQRWRLVHCGAGRYKLQSMAANLMLQGMALPAPGVALNFDDLESADSLMWRIELVDVAEQSYCIVNLALGLALGIPNARQDSGAAATLSKWTSSPAQQWQIYEDLG